MKYSENIDYLLASIIYLGSHSWWWARSPKSMASELSLDEHRLEQVFKGFPGLFRKSVRTDDETGQHYYSLQARYAQKKGGDTSDPEKVSFIPQLATEKLELLITFVMKMAEHEQTRGLATRTQVVAVTAAIVSALAALVAAYFGHK